jgi:membrane-bound lytic murein transglycosylase D
MGNLNVGRCRSLTLSLLLLTLMSACAHTPENTKNSLSLPFTQQVKETPKPIIAPESWQVHSTEENTRSGAVIIPKRQPQSKSQTANYRTSKSLPTKIRRTLPPKTSTTSIGPTLVFDIPVAYNPRVKYWVEYFQTTGRVWFVKWLERSPRYLPSLQTTLSRHGLPKDLAYIAMIESGFSSQASSTAKAVGPWQFIRETGERYGLKVAWWLDERKDFQKSTDAAAKYLKKLYGMFHNWYLVAASYNTGENRIKRQIKKKWH